MEEFDTPNGGGFCRARAGLGVSAFGMQVENFPPHFEHFPAHDHAADGQEEVYTLLSGAATLHVDGRRTRSCRACLRVSAPAYTADHDRRTAVQLLAIGATPGQPYIAPAFTENGAPLPG